MKSFLQTTEWLEFQREAGKKCWRYEQDGIVANIIRHDLPLGKNYLYIPYGPQFDLTGVQGGLKNALTKFMSYLRQLAKTERSVFVKIEPTEDQVIELLYPFGLRKSTRNIQPQKTLIVDLGPSEQEILGQMHQKTRYNIGLGARKDLQLIESKDVKTFWELLKKTATHDNFTTHKFPYYEKLLSYFENGKEIKTKLFLVTLDGQPIAGAIRLVHDDTVYYLHGGMDRDFKQTMAPYFMHWQIMSHYKKLDVRYCDFWGIDHNFWPGVTRFKLGFGGRVVEYPGAFDLPVQRFWYWLYQLKQKPARMIGIIRSGGLFK